jgi:SAM-dependent methyltransferase
MTSTGSPYLLANAGADAPARLSALASMFDATTQRHLLGRGVGPGWHCLEVGGGGGSIASWLANRVLPDGRVVATDLDTRFLETLSIPNLEVRRHDIVTDPLPESTFDLIHVRLVLVHLSQWESVLERLVAALKPGGWLVDEEFDSDSLPPDPVTSPGESPAQDLHRYRAADDGSRVRPTLRPTALRAPSRQGAGKRGRGGAHRDAAAQFSGRIAHAGELSAASRRDDRCRLRDGR